MQPPPPRLALLAHLFPIYTVHKHFNNNNCNENNYPFYKISFGKFLVSLLILILEFVLHLAAVSFRDQTMTCLYIPTWSRLCPWDLFIIIANGQISNWIYAVSFMYSLERSAAAALDVDGACSCNFCRCFPPIFWLFRSFYHLWCWWSTSSSNNCYFSPILSNVVWMFSVVVLMLEGLCHHSIDEQK